MLQHFIDANNGMITFLGTAFGLLSLILSVFFFYKTVVRKELSVGQKYDRLIHCDEILKDFPKNDGEPEGCLMVAYILAFNSGNTTLEEDDFPRASLLHFYSKTNISTIEIIGSSSFRNNFHIESQLGPQSEPESNTHILRFDYMDKGDGCVIKAYFNNGQGDFVFSGKVKGSKKIKKFALLDFHYRAELFTKPPNKRKIILKTVLNGLFFVLCLVFGKVDMVIGFACSVALCWIIISGLAQISLTDKMRKYNGYLTYFNAMLLCAVLFYKLLPLTFCWIFTVPVVLVCLYGMYAFKVIVPVPQDLEEVFRKDFHNTLKRVS